MSRTIPQRIFDGIFRVPQETINHSIGDMPSSDEPLDAALKRCMHQLKATAITPDTGYVDYQQLRTNAIYQDYRQLTNRLINFDLQTLRTREARLAFWINLYNVLVIDGIIHYRIQNSVTEMSGFFRQTAYCIGGYRFSLDDIEHGILRANAGHPFIPGAQFMPHDPRHQFALSHLDYRMHFALVCGANSCPPIAFYDAATIDEQLDIAAQSFLAQEIDIQYDAVHLSKILQWYSVDFGGSAWVKWGFGDKHTVLATLSQHMPADRQAALNRATQIRFKPYDWSLNAR